MRNSEPSQINQLQAYLPACTKCGNSTNLVGIEPAAEPDHDVRSFECSACGNVHTVTVKFR